MSKNNIHPKEFANKSSKKNLFRAIDYALIYESSSIRLNTQTFNEGRYRAIKQIHDYEILKTRAREIKEEAIRNLPTLIEKLTYTIKSRGGNVFYAKDKYDAVNYIKEICKSNNAKLIVKSKSITSEEIKLNEALEEENIEIVETDLAEFILQLSKEQPSHIVAPAIHRSRESISMLFKKNFRITDSLDTGEQLTEFASKTLRQKFLGADIGITGANLISAEEGSILLVESEGNIRLTTHLPAIHIAIVGIEKIIPSRKDFGIFIELLAASATGQSLTSYTNILEPPLDLPILNLNNRSDKERKFYLVLIDNGRMRMREDPELKEALYCIRCSACMNVCANFQTVGGHAFGGECYTGGIGAAWTIGTSGQLVNGRFAELCTGCSRCLSNCPVKIDIPRLNTVIKDRLNKLEFPSLQKYFFSRFNTLASIASKIPSVVNMMVNFFPVKLLIDQLLGIDKEREISKFAKKTFTQLYKSRSAVPSLISNSRLQSKKIMIFSDIYTNYNNPQIGIEAVELLEKLGFNTKISNVIDDGRASLSQGMIKYSEKKAIETSLYLKSLIDEGFDILFLEPSVLAMIRYDYKKLIHNDNLFYLLANKCYDIFEYLNILIEKRDIEPETIKKYLQPSENKIFYHCHCQLKSIGLGSSVPVFFCRIGFSVIESTQECCGMAGSFGYKKHYYHISKSLGTELVKQIRLFDSNLDEVVVLASGTSCREQLKSFMSNTKKIYHPIEYLNKMIVNIKS